MINYVYCVQGNVHTGATPPWLKEDDDEEEAPAIGPSLNSFLLHSAVNVLCAYVVVTCCNV